MNRRLRADSSLAFCSPLWGATFVVVKNALDGASVFIFLAVRFRVAAVLILAKRLNDSAAVGIIFYVDGVEHGGGGGVRFFVGGDVGLVLHGGADVIEALQ
jgi:drug/metabolite transporter (DMT)-like permease